VGLVWVPVGALGAQSQPGLVSTNPADFTPQVVSTAAVPQPHVDAIGVVGGTTIIGGLFDTLSQGGRSYARGNVAAFDSTTGALLSGFDTRLAGGQVWAIATDPATNSVYVGGRFTTVDGVARTALVKLDATTGERDRVFKPPFASGQVNDLELSTLGGVKRLVVAGGVGRRLLSLDPATGASDGYFDAVNVTDPIPNAWQGLSVYQVAIDPSRTRLVATGNFRTVNGQGRTRMFMLDTGAKASLSSWYYPGFAKPCSSTAPRRIAYLQGVDWSPDGSAFTVAATGQIPLTRADIWYQRLGAANKPNTTVCDGVGRFRLSDPSKPQWINYTGGDSVWQVADTGAAVYASGHFRWLDNPDGHASEGVGDATSGTPAASRRGIGAIDPATGLANSWNPGLTATRIGGKALLATSGGLWVGNDATHFKGEAHYGLGFAPLP